MAKKHIKEPEKDQLLATKAEDVKRLAKYVSSTIYLKVGHSQLISRKPFGNFDEVKHNSDLYDPLPHIRKILTTDRRVLEIKDFPQPAQLKDKASYFSQLIHDSSLPLDRSKPDDNIRRLAILLP